MSSQAVVDCNHDELVVLGAVELSSEAVGVAELWAYRKLVVEETAVVAMVSQVQKLVVEVDVRA